jgi:Uma2 family endonuclease
MGLPQAKNGRYTYTDYATWPDEIRCEIIDGEIYDMSPAPGRAHQKTVVALVTALASRLKGHKCKVFVAPFDVVLSQHDVVQPDVLVVCNPGKITEKNIQGAPDLIVEVLSPSTALNDLRVKKELYRKFRVREYVIIHPTERYVMQHNLLGGGGEAMEPSWTEAALLAPDETLVLRSLDGLEIPLAEVFEE